MMKVEPCVFDLHICFILLTTDEVLFIREPLDDYPYSFFFITMTEQNQLICSNRTIYDDERLELTEWTGLTLTILFSTGVTVMRNENTAIQIIDDDSM